LRGVQLEPEFTTLEFSLPDELVLQHLS
jgi:hypothetical protein